MPGMFPSARRAHRRAVASALAAGAAFAGAGFATALATSAPAYAQPAKPTYSPNFVKAYQPIDDAVKKGGDLAAARGQVPALVAAVQTADDRDAAGGLLIQLGVKLNDRALQRQGLELRLASGKVAAQQVGQMQFLLGGLAYEANDFAAARSAFEAARAAGYPDEALPGLLTETYFKQNQYAAGLDYLKGVIAQRMAAHSAVPQDWLLRGLQVAYQNKLTAQANEWAALLVSTNPSPSNWTAALQVIGAVNPLDKSAELDLYRLMDTTKSLSQKGDYMKYVDAADPRIMSNEVARILQNGVAAGVLKASDSDYQEIKRVVDQRTAADRADAPKLVAAARTSANGNAAMSAGDVLYSLGQYAEAGQMYQLALQKGGVDKDKALTRLGIAQAQQGKKAEAKATFAQVAGARAPVARMWEAYVSANA